MEEFEEKLISAIFLWPYIYDKNDKRHSKKTFLAEAWKEISKEVGVEGELTFLHSIISFSLFLRAEKFILYFFFSKNL